MARRTHHSAEQLQDVQVAVGEEIHAQAHQHQHAGGTGAMGDEDRMGQRARGTAQLHAHPGQAVQAATDRMHMLAHRRLGVAHRLGHHRLQLLGAVGVVLGHAIAEHQPVAGLRLGQLHHFQRVFLEVDEAHLLAIPGEVAWQRLAEIGPARMRLGDGLHRRHHQPVAPGLIGLAQAGIERTSVVADHQRRMAGAQHVRHVHALRVQFCQATGFGFACGITAAVRWRARSCCC
ncbi:hypothetical protein G6F65_017784 [Rhizopus arrhizus]|nr:hypothetical protein G6F65_017784 [Rhizopus arrhizus]